MAKAFVVRGDLLNEAVDKPVRVRAVYSNGMILTLESHGVECTLLLLADNLVIRDNNFQTVLKSTWRTDYGPVINAEANRRIELAFPDYKQRNYTARVQDMITTYGADASIWPQAERDFKAEADRGWQYVADVRTASNAWTAMPVDPTADSIWPPAITPIK